MKCVGLWLAILLLLVGSSVAQNFTGDFILSGSRYSTSDAVFRINRSTLALTTLTTGILPGTTTPMPHSIEIEGSNEVQPFLQKAPNDRQIGLSFPGHGGKAYVCAVGITGIRPGLPLGDGRLIHLVFDQIAIASLQGALDPLIPNRVGVLSSTGTAVTGLNVNLLGKTVRGLTTIFQVVVLDARAPVGIAVVAEPYAIKLE